MNEPRDIHFARHLKQNKSSLDVCFNRSSRLVNTPVNVRFRREMNYSIAPSHRRLDADCVADIPFDELIAWVGSDRIQIGQISGVGQLVIVDDFVALPESQDMPNEIRADKAGTARNKKFHR